MKNILPFLEMGILSMKSETSKLHQAFVKELKEQMGLVEKPKEKFRIERRKHSGTDDIHDVLDIQRELERKFDELFGCEDEDD